MRKNEMDVAEEVWLMLMCARKCSVEEVAAKQWLSVEEEKHKGKWTK